MTGAGVSITTLVHAQRSGAVSAEQIVRDALERIVSDTSNAVVAVEPDAALATAARADRARAAGAPLGALHGVPVTIKDSFAVAGLHLCQGAADGAGTAATDAPAVARLREAGAIVVGKTNVSEHLADLQAQNPVHGRTINPHDAARTPGGSSGGSAAALAAGLVWGDLGSDLGGSIRVPAAWCGVYGHRPSNGIVSKRGHLPWPVDARVDVSASAAGPMARRAADLRTLLTVLTGAAGVERRVWRVELPPARFDDLRGLRVGLWTEPALPVDDEQAAALDALAAGISTRGGIVRPVTGSPLATAEAEELYRRVSAYEIAWPSRDPHGAPISVVMDDAQRRLELREQWEARLDDVDVVIAPVVPHAAPPHSATPLAREIGRWSCVTNLGTGPCTVVPLRLGPSGLPVAVQVVAGFGHDLSTLRVAQLLEDTGLAHAPRPAVSAPDHPVTEYAP